MNKQNFDLGSEYSEATVAQTETPIAGTRVQQTLTVKDVRLWLVDEPNLYTLVSEVSVDGSLVDSETTAFGIRSIAVDAQSGLRLNGVSMKLKGGCVHHDHGILGAVGMASASLHE